MRFPLLFFQVRIVLLLFGDSAAPPTGNPGPPRSGVLETHVRDVSKFYYGGFLARIITSTVCSSVLASYLLRN